MAMLYYNDTRKKNFLGFIYWEQLEVSIVLESCFYKDIIFVILINYFI